MTEKDEQAGRPEYIIVYSAMVFSGFLAGVFIGWVIWA